MKIILILSIFLISYSFANCNFCISNYNDCISNSLSIKCSFPLTTCNTLCNCLYTLYDCTETHNCSILHENDIYLLKQCNISSIDDMPSILLFFICTLIIVIILSIRDYYLFN